jgi:hypothetical protein
MHSRAHVEFEQDESQAIALNQCQPQPAVQAEASDACALGLTRRVAAWSTAKHVPARRRRRARALHAANVLHARKDIEAGAVRQPRRHARPIKHPLQRGEPLRQLVVAQRAPIVL